MTIDLTAITAMICLTICFVAVAATNPDASSLLLTIVAALGGIGGYVIPKAVSGIKNRRAKK